MSDGPKYGVIAAIFRYIWFRNWKIARGIDRAADNMYTNSEEGIHFAAEIEKGTLKERYQKAISALAKLSTQFSKQKKELEGSDEKEKQFLSAIDGCLEAKLDAEEAHDDAKIKEVEADLANLQGQLTEEEARQTRMKGNMSRLDGQLRQIKRIMQDLEVQRGNLDRDEAEALSALVSEQVIRDNMNLVNDLMDSFDRGPMAAVRAKTAERTAEIEAMELQMNRESADDVTKKYADRSVMAKSDERFGAALEAKRAERAARRGEAPKKDTPVVEASSGAGAPAGDGKRF